MLNWTSSKRIDSELQPKQNENLNETEKLKSNRKCKGALNGQNRYGNAKWWRGELSRKGWNVKIDLIKWSNVQQDHSIQGSATQSTNCNCKWNSWKVNHWQRGQQNNWSIDQTTDVMNAVNIAVLMEINKSNHAPEQEANRQVEKRGGNGISQLIWCKRTWNWNTGTGIRNWDGSQRVMETENGCGWNERNGKKWQQITNVSNDWNACT